MSDALVRRWRFTTLACIAALLALVFAWQLDAEFSAEHTARALALSVPLIAPLYGLWLGQRYTYRWATLCVLPYFVVGLTEAVANSSARAWAAGMLVLALCWFIALIAYLRVTAPHEPAHVN